MRPAQRDSSPARVFVGIGKDLRRSARHRRGNTFLGNFGVHGGKLTGAASAPRLSSADTCCVCPTDGARGIEGLAAPAPPSRLRAAPEHPGAHRAAPAQPADRATALTTPMACRAATPQRDLHPARSRIPFLARLTPGAHTPAGGSTGSAAGPSNSMVGHRSPPHSPLAVTQALLAVRQRVGAPPACVLCRRYRFQAAPVKAPVPERRNTGSGTVKRQLLFQGQRHPRCRRVALRPVRAGPAMPRRKQPRTPRSLPRLHTPLQAAEGRSLSNARSCMSGSGAGPADAPQRQKPVCTARTAPSHRRCATDRQRP